MHNAVADPKQHEVIQNYQNYLVPCYAPSLIIEKGKGSYVWDSEGKKYLDFASGIAVNSLGTAHPAITEALTRQSETLTHVSNLYYHRGQGELAKRLVELTGPGKMFFCNSGAEANEMLYKLARKFGHDEGRYEIITAINSFHGRTLAGIAATGQDKVKKGFEPIIEGFKHVPYNDLGAIENAISNKTAAVLIESIQGEGGITQAKPEYLLGLRKLCTEKNILLFTDSVQCGMFRSGCFQSYQRILENHPQKNEFLPDGISMAKSLGGGFPMGAVWIRSPYADLFQAGSHGTTYGGSPLACAVSLAVLDTIKKEKLADNIRKQGDKIRVELEKHIGKGNKILKEVRGCGGLLGLLLTIPAKDFVTTLKDAGLLVVPAGTEVVRLLPALNISDKEVEEGLSILKAHL
jgi:acetylornithine/N-succinyldiaminopimelate aminotransferase